MRVSVLSEGRENLGTLYTLLRSRPEVNAQIVLRKTTPAAADFINLDQISGGAPLRI